MFLGASNPNSTSIENTLDILKAGITEITEGFDASQTAVYAGIAGIKSGNNQNIINSFLSRFGFASFDCGSDTELVLEIALKGENGTQVDYRSLSEMSRCKHNFVLGLCNDELGYIIPENDFYLHEWLPYFNNAVDESGRKHYEETNSLGPKAAGKIPDAMDKLISSVE